MSYIKLIIAVAYFVLGLIFLPGAMAAMFLRDEEEGAISNGRGGTVPYWFRVLFPLFLILCWSAIILGVYKLCYYCY